MRNQTLPNHTLPFTERIDCIELCGSEFATNLICIASENKLILGLIRLPEESDCNEFSWERLKDIYHESRCYAICFNTAETSLVILPRPNIFFCAAGADFSMRIYRNDLEDAGTVQTLKGHSSYINDIAWDTKGKYLASVSDDHKCKIWLDHSDYKETITFCLTSSGMAVKWNPLEPNKLLVAEKKGIIHFYNVQTQQAIISVETPKNPLMSADWSLCNRLFVTALAAGDIVTFDLRRTSSPADIKSVHEDGGRIVRFSPSNDCVTASIGKPDYTLKVFTAKSNVPIIEAPLKIFSGNCLSWHHRLPYVIVAQDRQLTFWKVQTK